MAIPIIREINADVVKRGSTRAIYAKQGDFNSRFLKVFIQEDGTNIIVAQDLTVILNVERSDKQENAFYGTVNEDGTVQVPLTAWMLELEGTLVCDISIVSEDPTVAKLTTMQFNIYVESAVVSDASIVETEEYSIIVDLLTRTTEAAQIAENAATNAELLRIQCEYATEAATAAASSANATMKTLYDTNVGIIVEELAKRGQLKPEFANSPSECTDTSKLYVLPDGYIYACVKKHNIAEPLFTNRLPLAIGSDGKPFNGGLGYQEGYRLQSSDGAAVQYDNRCVTGFIEAKKGDTIRTKGITFISDSMQVSYTSSFGKSGTMSYPSTFTPVDGVYTFTVSGSSTSIYIRISAETIAKDAIITVNEEIAYSEPGDYYVWENTGHAFVPADYEGRIISLEDTSEEHESRISSIEEQIENDNSGEETNLTNAFNKLFMESENLYNSYKKVPFVVINSSGEEVQNYAYFSTERIAVKPSTNYTFSYFTYASWFDENGEFIRRQDAGNNAAGVYVMTLVSPENAAYLIASTTTGTNENTLDQQGVIQGIVEGDSFEGVGKYKATTLKTRDDFVEYQTGISKTDRYILDMNIPNIFTTERTYEDKNITSLTPAQVHSLFSEFATSHPTYVTKTVLGNNASGEEIAYYTFNPEMASHENAIKVPTIFINCAIHGDEKQGTQAVYYAMKDIIDNWKTDETLELLRHNVKFIINPCANPDGWKNHTRKNGNGVDLARNFPAAWYGNSATTSQSYGGTAPLSEKESQFIKSILDNNKDISVTIDFHSFPDNDANVNLLYWYEPVSYGLPIHIATNFNNKMSRNYAKRFDWVSDGEFVGTTYIGGYRQYNFYGEDGGKLGQTAAIQYGQELSGTFEIKRSISQIIEDADYTQKYLRYSVEAIVNFICEMLKGMSI